MNGLWLATIFSHLRKKLFKDTLGGWVAGGWVARWLVTGVRLLFAVMLSPTTTHRNTGLTYFLHRPQEIKLGLSGLACKSALNPEGTMWVLEYKYDSQKPCLILNTVAI